MTQERRNGLLAWQWAAYPAAHQNRRNLLVHALTAPVFMAGTLALVAAPFVTPWLALGGVLAIVTAVALQGRGHRREQAPPAPFRGPMDVVLRLVVEQWVTFPRYVVSGGFGRAWRGYGAPNDLVRTT